MKDFVFSHATTAKFDRWIKVRRPLRLSVLLLLAAALWSAATAQIEVVSSGNVGIGTTNPNGVLHVVTPVNSDTGQPRFLSGGSTANEWNEILLGAGIANYKAAMFRYFNGEGTASTALLNITHYGDVGGISLRGGGNVGIGTTTPQTKLDVSGGLRVGDGTQSGGPASNLLVRRAAGDSVTYFNLINEYSVTHTIASGGSGHRADLYFSNDSSGNYIFGTGNVGIGATSPGYKLEVAGTVRASSFVSNTTTYADFVFKPGYRLAPLTEVEAHIEKHGHLPGIPSEAEAMTQGIDLAAMQVKLLQKIEELTLHQIAQAKDIAALKEENARLRTQLTGPGLQP